MAAVADTSIEPELELQRAIDRLRRVISRRLASYCGRGEDVQKLESAGHKAPTETLFQFFHGDRISADESVVLMLALVPHLYAGFLSELIAKHLPEGGDFPEFGGVKAGNHRGILPTGETAQFLLAGDNLQKRLQVQRMLSTDHWFSQEHVLWLEPVRDGEPTMSGRLILDAEIVEQVTVGKVGKPRFSSEFPAEFIQTRMEWEDLVLHPQTLQQIQEIEHWIRHNDTLLRDWGMGKVVKPGYRALFYGPPGTGKTSTATLLGKYTGKDVFRVDLSRVVSKYIGETEKNLGKLFDKAEHKNWIMFIDESEALCGKRTEIRDAHDKYANQEIAYLLQRIESYNGLVILATNQRSNMDDAFVRRLQAIIQFPMPRAEERYEIWTRTLPAKLVVADDIDWRDVAVRFELTGAGIVNVMHYCAIQSLADGSSILDRNQLDAAVMREFIKEGKIV